MRWTLSRKILLLAALNLALLGAVLAAFAMAQFRRGPEAILLGPAHDRIQAIANAFSVDLDSPMSDPAALFASYGKKYDAGFFLVNPDGDTMAGPPAVLPPEVVERMHRTRPPGAPRGRPPPRKKGPPPERKGDRKGRPPEDGPPPPPEDRKGPPGGRAPSPEAVFFAISHSPTAYWAGARIPAALPGMPEGTPAILLIRSASLFNSNLFFDFRIALALAASLLVVTAACWLPFIQNLTGTIAAMDRATEQMAQGQFDAQVSHGRGDELGHLAEQINRLASRLQNFVKNEKRFLGDIAHELCAPIARVQFALGILEQKSAADQQEHVAVLHEEIQEMSALVNELLSFSRAGLNPMASELTAVDVTAVIGRVVARDGAPGASIQVEAPPELQARASEPLLMRALSNLLRNAVRYAGPAGPVTISARRDGDAVEILVSDCGPGVPEEELERIFAAFYRPEEARTRETGGAGLGLAIVRTCVEACGGTVFCRNRASHGLEVVVRLKA
jgi:two-component system sensor histidine kinase CpxA